MGLKTGNAVDGKMRMADGKNGLGRGGERVGGNGYCDADRKGRGCFIFIRG